MMSLIGMCNGSSFMIKPKMGLCFDELGCSIRGINKRNQISCMVSTSPAPLTYVEEGEQQLTGDSFIRPHLLKLSPYQPIVPFEVIKYIQLFNFKEENFFAIFSENLGNYLNSDFSHLILI